MRQFMAIAKALGDENRVRILLSLRQGELCLCQIVEVLGVSPSTVSKHVDMLRQAGLLEMRKQGRWHYFSLARREATPEARQAINWVLKSLENEKVIVSDAAKLCCVRDADPRELTTCYSTK